MKENNNNNNLMDSIDEIILQLKEFCSEEELEELKIEVEECLEDGMTKKSLLYILSNLNNTGLIIKAKQEGISVKEVFDNLAIHCGHYNEESSFYDEELDYIEKEINYNDEIEEDLYDDGEVIVRLKHKNPII